MAVIRQSDLPWSSIAHELVGDDHGGIGLCVIFVDAEPGRGPGLHTHQYDEVLIIQEGRATATVGDEIPLATTASLLAPVSVPLGTSNCVETIAGPVATPIVL